MCTETEYEWDVWSIAEVIQSEPVVDWLASVDVAKVARSTTRQLRRLARGGAKISDSVVVLDTAAERSMFRDVQLFGGEFYRLERPLLVEGINEEAEGLLITQQGLTAFGEVAYDRRCAANILSFGYAVDNFDRVIYDSSQDEFLIRVSAWSEAMRFRRDELSNLYLWSAEDTTVPIISETWVVTVDDRMAKYSHREIAAAEEARELQRRFFFLGDTSLEQLLRQGKIKNTKVTAIDVRRARDIWGPSLGVLKGKSTSRKGAAVEQAGERIKTLQPKDQILHSDLMDVNGIWYLISVMDPAEYVQISRLRSKSDWDIWTSLQQQLKFPEKFGLRIATVRVDGESGMASEWFQAKAGELLDTTGAGVAVPVVERKIRTVKERVRAVINTLPYELTERLEEWAVKAAVYSVNMVPTKNSTSYESPREKLYGRYIDAATDLRHAFGDYCHIHEEVIDNTMKARTQAAIALRPTGALDGSWWFWLLRTNKVVRRRRSTALPITIDVIDAINKAARKRKFKSGRPVKKNQIILRPDKWNIPDDGEDLEPGAYPMEWVEPVQLAGEPGADDAAEDNDLESVDTQLPDVEDQPDDVYSAGNWEDRQQIIRDIFGDDDDEEEPQLEQEQVAQEAEIEKQAEDSVEDRRYPGRERRQPIRYATDSIYGLKLSISEGIAQHGFEAVMSTVKEVKQMLDEDVWEGVESNTLTAEEWKSVISSMLFLKEKYSPAGEFLKLKSRLVAGGHQQVRELYGDSSSPTVATQTVMMIVTIAAAEGRSVAAVDVPGAFLKSDMPTDGPAVFMKLNKFITSVLVKLDSSYKKFVRADGTTIVRLKRALYGCIQASKAWYQKLSGDLRSLGYTANPSDGCCWNRVEDNGTQSTIIFHVDDLFITASSDILLEGIIKQLDRLYSDDQQKITVQRGTKMEYLGMIFKFNADMKTVTVSMEGFIGDLLKDLGDIAGTAKTPAGHNLFRVRDTALQLEEQKRELFHSIMAKILYLSKRARPDLLVAVAFLVRRVQHPDTDDWEKMERLIRYIRGTKELGIRLAGERHLSVTAYVDASYGVHSDMKSHTGAMITLGRGPVFAKSTVQKLNTVSSAESELVALSESVGQVLWTREFLQHQGYIIGPAKIFEDNQSAIKLAQNGRSNSPRTRHIAVRYFFISDRMKSGEIAVEYLNTADMIADILTKPMQGAQFIRLRNLLLNWELDV